jgi:alpha-D-ribose 1-methylphosphonate 5-triphosphate synthase subunit PhnH
MVSESSTTLPERIRLCSFDALQSQMAFDVMLRTIARPSTIHRLERDRIGILPPALALVAVVADVEQRLHVLEDGADEWRPAILRATGAKEAALESSDVALVRSNWSGTIAEVVPLLQRGTALDPEAGARVIVECVALAPEATGPSGSANVETTTIELTGPGVPGRRRVTVSGLTADFFVALAAVNSDFPSGVDAWLVDHQGHVTAIPRSSEITIVTDDATRLGGVH